MKELFNNAGFVALLGTLLGGAGLKIIETWLGRAKERASEAASMREELRKEIADLRAQLQAAAEEERRLEAQVDDWKQKYWDLRDEKQKAVTDLTIALERIKAVDKQVVTG